MPDEPSDFVASMSTAITRRADMYVEVLSEATKNGKIPFAESELLERFEGYVNDILDRYIPPGPRVRSNLVFSRMYTTATNKPVTDSRRALIAGLLAAETENRGPLRLTQAQTARLAEVFERLGRGLSAEKLPGHAALAFERASLAYLQLGDHLSRDRCLYARACARHRTRRRGWTKLLETVSKVLSGYGFRPYRLLGWACVQLVVFSIVLDLISPGPAARNAYMVAINYVNLLGVGDTTNLPHGAWVLFIVEGYTGALTTSVFFALLVRRWFRL